MKKFTMIGILFLFLTSSAFSQPQEEKKYWELKQEVLETLISQSDLIVSGKITEDNHIKVEEVILGVQQQIKRIMLAEIGTKKFDPELSYIAFLKRKNGFFVPISEHSFIKNDIFLMTRVRKESMKNRIASSDFVVVATVHTVKEVTEEQKIEVTAECQVSENLKGALGEKFTVQYTRIPNVQPPTLFLFENLAYIFFVKKVDDKLFLLNSYDSALGLRTQVIKEVKALTSVENNFDDVADLAVDGIQLIAQAEEKIAHNKPIMLNIVLQNVDSKTAEIYHNPEQIYYFILFHIIDSKGNLMAVEYPRKGSIPNLDRIHFLKLNSGDYCLFPSFNLQQYCKLSPGKYSLYVEYDLPWKYSGKNIGKSAWYGKVMSNRMELEISE